MITHPNYEVNHGWHEAIQFFFYQVHGRLKHTQTKLWYHVLFIQLTHSSEYFWSSTGVVVAGELVNHLLVVSDSSCAGVLRADHAWDGDVLDSGKYCKYSESPLQWTLRKVRVRVCAIHLLCVFKLKSPSVIWCRQRLPPLWWRNCQLSRQESLYTGFWSAQS